MRETVIKFRYGTIIGKHRDLEEMRDSLSPFLFANGVELYSRVDNAVEAVEKKTGFAPNNIKVTIVALPDTDAVDAAKQRVYQGFAPNLGRPAFADLLTDTIYISAERVTLRILRHEIGHILFKMCCTERPSPALHEHVAQFCERP